MKRDEHLSMAISGYITYKYDPKFTPFQLIKLVFIAHGKTLAMVDAPLIHDHVEACDNGPVIPAM